MLSAYMLPTLVLFAMLNLIAVSCLDMPALNEKTLRKGLQVSECQM